MRPKISGGRRPLFAAGRSVIAGETVIGVFRLKHVQSAVWQTLATRRLEPAAIIGGFIVIDMRLSPSTMSSRPAHAALTGQTGREGRATTLFGVAAKAFLLLAGPRRISGEHRLLPELSWDR